MGAQGQGVWDGFEGTDDPRLCWFRAHAVPLASLPGRNKPRTIDPGLVKETIGWR